MWLRAGWAAVLDTEPRFRSANLALLATGEEHHTVAIVARDDIVPRTLLDTGFDHFAIAFPSAGDVVSSYERLKALGVDAVSLGDPAALAAELKAADAVLVTAAPDTEGCPGLRTLVPAMARAGAFPGARRGALCPGS